METLDISAEYTAKLEEYYEAERSFRKVRKMAKFDKIAEILIIIIGIFTISTKNYVLGVTELFFGVFFLSGLGGKLVTFINFKRLISDRGEQKIIFSEEKITYYIKAAKSELEWNYYEDYMETENTILLIFDKKRHYGVIPKRVFSKEDLEKLLELLERKFNS